ncbi:MAG: acyl-CoA oxidase [Actinobacteria bacterium HGW-Actinobacteria-2]|nr:MAG: acyl-CoA oxidase [Actinobacteria bacterium HGW-Actinobacteria-2]
MTLLMNPTEELTGLGAALRRTLDGEFAERRAQARANFPVANLHRDPEQDLATARQWVLDRLVEVGRSGALASGVPTSADDPGDVTDTVIAFELMAHGDLSATIKSGVQLGLFGGAVANLGTAWHHDTFLADIASLKLLGCYGMTELGHGSDVFELETTITYIPETDEFEVHSQTEEATKAYIGNAANHGTMAVVFGQMQVRGRSYGVHAVLVPIRDDAGQPLPGVVIGDHGGKGGLLGIDNGTLRFERVRVPRRMLLDRFGGVNDKGVYSSPLANANKRFFAILSTLVRGRVCVAAAGGIAARRGLSIATRYALQRRQFSAPGHPDGVLLADYAIHQRRLLPLIARAYALGFAQNEVTASLARLYHRTDADAEQRQLETRAAGLKAMTTQFANVALQECREACGGAGYLAENRLVQLRADADVFATFEGDNTVLLQQVAKALLGDYAHIWGELKTVDMVQATARVFGDSVLERTSATVVVERLIAAARRQPEHTTLVDRGWQALLFTERERHSLESLARRARKAGKKFDALNQLGDHLLFVARAHLERITLEAFIAAIESCQDEQARPVLEKLCSLYALSSIHSDRAWFLEHGKISTSRSKAIGAEVGALCGQLRPDALALVEGFGIPAPWLGAAFLDD